MMVVVPTETEVHISRVGLLLLGAGNERREPIAHQAVAQVLDKKYVEPLVRLTED